jgi:hypothetical protein
VTWILYPCCCLIWRDHRACCALSREGRRPGTAGGAIAGFSLSIIVHVRRSVDARTYSLDTASLYVPTDSVVRKLCVFCKPSLSREASRLTITMYLCFSLYRVFSCSFDLNDLEAIVEPPSSVTLPQPTSPLVSFQSRMLPANCCERGQERGRRPKQRKLPRKLVLHSYSALQQIVYRTASGKSPTRPTMELKRTKNGPH